MAYKFNLLMLSLLLMGFTLGEKPLPMVFVIGDSISIQYGPYLEKFLVGTWEYSRKEGDSNTATNLDIPTGANGGDSRMVLEFLKIKMKEPGFQPDVLLLNCGLHDIKRDTQTNGIQVEIVQYKQNLEEIHKLVTEKGVGLVWIKSTPVDDEQHNDRSKGFKRFVEDLALYNQVADEIFQSRKVPIIDLFNFTKNLGDGDYTVNFIDHVHYNEEARALQAAFIAGFLLNLNSY